MAFDQTTRNRLARFVSDTRSLLAEEFTRQLQNDYGLDPNSGDVTELARLEHLDDARRETARLLRDTMEHYLASADTATPAKAKKARQDVLGRIVREQAFTILNRLCALRMAEARGLLIESIAKGYQSKGFQLYQRLAGTALGETGACYRLFIFSVFDEFAVDLPVLFDRFSPQGRLFPREAALLNVLQEINHTDIDPLWAEDETIGWIYQYFNSVEERRQMRAASQAPRNSRELAVRNQFFTPRYVVEFLTDNTLGRIWYEMTKGESSLKDSCRYLVRRPTEIFLSEGEAVPDQDDTGEDLSQEELLKQPVHILHRPLKDPRDIKMLDPACGSMHFGLYAFDLFERIYEEAWEIEAQRGADGFVRTEELKPLHESYTDKTAFLRDMPRLIIERNIHGIDIDPRAVQIAGLSLWLRAQRSWQVQNVKALDRPQIQRSNIVCAEPMPGEADMLEEFTEQLQPKVLGQLVKIIFEKMKLAGEVGSLLKIEENIKDAIADAHKAYQEFILQQKKKMEFLPGMAPERETTFFDFADLPKEEDFWHTAEQRVIDTLRDYAETAAADSFQRRLFAADAARGFAFIDICRKRYEAVVMNPPFGVGLKTAEKYLKIEYPGSGNDEVCASFYSRALDILEPGGRIGEISSRTCFFLPTLAEWRINILFESSSLMEFVDLGINVLDDAVNETAAYVSEKSLRAVPSVFGMFHRSSDKADSVNSLTKLELKANTFVRNVRDFAALPDRPLCYWVSSLFLTALKLMKPFGSGAASVQMGLAPRDEFRFSRLWWEVDPYNVGGHKQWFAYAKGGELSPYYSDVELLLNGQDDLREIKAALNQKYPYLKGNLDWVLHPENDYFEPGLTFGQRTSHLRVSVLPSGCYFSVAGKGIFGRQISTSSLLQAVNTPSAQYLVNLRRESFEMNPQFQEGDVSRMPWPELEPEVESELAQLGLTSARAVREVASFDEIDHAFILPTIDDRRKFSVRSAEAMIADNEQKADLLIAPLLSLAAQDLWFIESEVTPRWHSRSIANWFRPMPSRDGIFYLLGTVFGRWDIRYATGESQLPKLPDPFDPLPVCSPSMLQSTEGLPAEPKDVPADYPVRISWPGVLVDDENHPEDIVARVRVAIEVTWKNRAEAVEQEACEILGVRSIRDYFQRPASFFADHLKRYTKSRRQAPIYWPLSTPSCSYTIWLYYHRLTDQTLYTGVNDFVDPKLKQVSDDTASLRSKSNRSSAEEKELERLSDFELELKDFRDELLRIARFWKPNLNDGVQITAAPLWNLFQHRQWKARLKETWEKLEAGDYDWAHLALSIWPDRVVRASHKDRSYAIAHDLEDVLWHEVEVEKVGRGGRVTRTTEWQPRDLSSADLQRIITEVKAR
jgi:hypothetical protein